MTPGEFISALHEEADNVTDIVKHDLEDSNSFVMAQIPDKGDIKDNTQTDSFEYTTATPAFTGYADRDNSPRALVEGSMEAEGCNGKNRSFTTNVNEKDPLACGDGFCEFTYAQGFRRFQSKDFERPMSTPIYCVNDYLRIGDAHVDGFFAGMYSSYRKYGMENYEAELQNRVIEFGEANGSITSGAFTLTKGGWHAPPEGRLSISYLIDYRDHMMFEDALDADGNLSIEVTRNDWYDAIVEHQGRKAGALGAGNASFNVEVLKDPKEALYGRSFHVYEDIKAVFIARPVRGYFKPDGVHPVTGATQYAFVRVFPKKNIVEELGGVGQRPNHDYNQARIKCDGQTYDMCTLAFHIHPTAFSRFRIKETMKPVGDAQLPTNFSISVLDGAWLPNNKKNSKFQLISNHAYRLKCEHAERAGAIAYCHSKDDPYLILPTRGAERAVGEAEVFAQEHEKCAPNAAEIEACGACGQDANDNHQCVDKPGDSAVSMSPSGGKVTTLSDGTAHAVTLDITRTGVTSVAGSVDYALTELGDAVADTHYTAANGTIAFAAGETHKTIYVAILTGDTLDGVDDGVKVTLSNPVGVTLEDTYVDLIIVDAS